MLGIIQGFYAALAVCLGNSSSVYGYSTTGHGSSAPYNAAPYTIFLGLSTTISGQTAEAMQGKNLQGGGGGSAWRRQNQPGGGNANFDGIIPTQCIFPHFPAAQDYINGLSLGNTNQGKGHHNSCNGHGLDNFAPVIPGPSGGQVHHANEQPHTPSPFGCPPTYFPENLGGIIPTSQWQSGFTPPSTKKGSQATTKSFGGFYNGVKCRFHEATNFLGNLGRPKTPEYGSNRDHRAYVRPEHPAYVQPESFSYSGTDLTKPPGYDSPPAYARSTISGRNYVRDGSSGGQDWYCGGGDCYGHIPGHQFGIEQFGFPGNNNCYHPSVGYQHGPTHANEFGNPGQQSMDTPPTAEQLWAAPELGCPPLLSIPPKAEELWAYYCYLQTDTQIIARLHSDYTNIVSDCHCRKTATPMWLPKAPNDPKDHNDFGKFLTMDFARWRSRTRSGPEYLLQQALTDVNKGKNSILRGNSGKDSDFRTAVGDLVQYINSISSEIDRIRSEIDKDKPETKGFREACFFALYVKLVEKVCQLSQGDGEGGLERCFLDAVSQLGCKACEQGRHYGNVCNTSVAFHKKNPQPDGSDRVSLPRPSTCFVPFISTPPTAHELMDYYTYLVDDRQIIARLHSDYTKIDSDPEGTLMWLPKTPGEWKKCMVQNDPPEFPQPKKVQEAGSNFCYDPRQQVRTALSAVNTPKPPNFHGSDLGRALNFLVEYIKSLMTKDSEAKKREDCFLALYVKLVETVVQSQREGCGKNGGLEISKAMRTLLGHAWQPPDQKSGKDIPGLHGWEKIKDFLKNPKGRLLAKNFALWFYECLLMGSYHNNPTIPSNISNHNKSTTPVDISEIRQDSGCRVGQRVNRLLSSFVCVSKGCDGTREVRTQADESKTTTVVQLKEFTVLHPDEKEETRVLYLCNCGELYVGWRGEVGREEGGNIYPFSVERARELEKYVSTSSTPQALTYPKGPIALEVGYTTLPVEDQVEALEALGKWGSMDQFCGDKSRGLKKEFDKWRNECNCNGRYGDVNNTSLYRPEADSVRNRHLARLRFGPPISTPPTAQELTDYYLYLQTDTERIDELVSECQNVVSYSNVVSDSDTSPMKMWLPNPKELVPFLTPMELVEWAPGSQLTASSDHPRHILELALSDSNDFESHTTTNFCGGLRTDFGKAMQLLVAYIRSIGRKIDDGRPVTVGMRGACFFALYVKLVEKVGLRQHGREVEEGDLLEAATELVGAPCTISRPPPGLQCRGSA